MSARSFDSQVNDIYARVAVLKTSTVPGLSETLIF